MYFDLITTNYTYCDPGGKPEFLRLGTLYLPLPQPLVLPRPNYPQALRRCVVDSEPTEIEQYELAPISKLAPELLGTMFNFVLESTVNRVSINAQSFHAQSFNPRTSLNFTYVCRRWRSVALGTPQLWRKLPFAYRKWTQVMLERSKTFALVIEMDFCDYKGPSVSKMAVLQRMKDVITQHADRIRRIELRGIESTQLKTLLDGTPDSPFRLTSLVLTTFCGQTHTIPTRIIPDLQRLRRLDLRGFRFTHLRVELEAPGPPKITSFFAALRAMPALQVLHLENSLSETYDIRDVEPISLRNLQNLRLVSPTGLSSVL